MTNKLRDFVVCVLPEALETPSASLVARTQTLLNEFELESFKGDLVALLDLKMIEWGIVHSGLSAPARLTQLVDQLSGTEVPGLTYEDVVFVNPESDMRTFTRGEVGRTEQMFYNEHRAIEGCLTSVIAKVRLALSAENVQDATHALEGVGTDLELVVSKTAGLRTMSREHFALFRKYLNSHPTRGLKGPSGAFTAGIPILELLFRSNELPQEYFEYLERSMKYFPRDGRAEILELLRSSLERNTLVSLWHRWGEDSALRERVDAIGLFLDRFRATHYRTVAHQIPEAIRGEISGTGGETNPGVFLRERIRMTHFGTRKDNSNGTH